jgi:hypothetical protein
MAARSLQVTTELADWAKRKPTFDFDPNGSHLFSILELAYSFAARSSELVSVIEDLLEKGTLVPAVILARALTETVGVGSLYVADMLRLASAGNLEALETRFTKFYAGQRDADIGPVHVLDGIRHLEKVDDQHFQKLAAKNPFLKAVSKLIGIGFAGSEVSVSANYAMLSEVAHPNGLGTQFLFPAPDTPAFEKEFREKLEFLCRVAIWQSHLLVRALRETEEFPVLYRKAFLPEPG